MAIPTPVQSRECAFVSAHEAAARLAADKILALVADIRTIPYVTVSTTRSGNDAPAQAFHDAELLARMRAPVRDALTQLTRTCYAHGWHDLATELAGLTLEDAGQLAGVQVVSVVLLRRAQAERDRLVAENLNLDAVLTRTENALHASRAQRDGLVAAYVGLIAGIRVDGLKAIGMEPCARAASKTATTTTE